ncbi:hypothetical protein QTO34_012389 [Cnephaeus nilssonii]|uniref:Sushi domain-containing protein n=1 Tax=Cnephaeus nilssonii TaxID=3371016 RepID=A0AA40HB00_CNENI|nr:hypothetical protein QTO34_012389 [Eptesicus nilssonii]
MLFLVQVILTLWVSCARGQELTCDPPIIPNGDFAPKMNQYELDYVITYQCGNGFYPPLMGNKTECTLFGWLPLPRCVRKSHSCLDLLLRYEITSLKHQEMGL